MAEREAIYKLKFMVDKAGQQESVRAIDALAKEFTEVDKNAHRVAQSAKQAVDALGAFERGRDELQATSDEAKQVAVSIEDATQALRRAGNASGNIQRIGDEAEQARMEIQKTTDAVSALERRLDAADEGFDVISRRVGLAGDVQSNIGAVRGIADLSGLEKQANIVGIAGEVVVLTEELPRLKLALQNMPDVVRFAATSIGATGIGLIGSLAALGVAIALLSKQASENRANVTEFIDKQREYNEFVSTATKETIDQRIADLKKQSEAERELLTTSRAARDELQQKTNEAFGETGASILRAIDSATGAIGTFDELDEQIKKSKDTISANEKEITKLTAAYSDQQVIANQLAVEEQLRIAERVQRAIGFYQTQYDLEVRYRDLITNGSKEQLDNAIEQNKFLTDANRERSQGLFTEIEVLKQAGKEIPAELQAAFDQTTIASNQLSKELLYLTETAAPLVESRSREGELINNLNAALEKQQDILTERVAAIKEQAQAELEFSRFLKTATAENVAARIEALQEEAASLRSILPELERMAPTSEAAANELKNTTDRLGEIDDALQQLGSAGVIAAIQREQAELTAEIEKIEAARDERIAQIRAQSAQKEIDLYEDLQQSLADAVADAQEKRIEAQQDYQEKAVEIEEDLAKKRADIEKKFARSMEQAVGDRDALAAYQAKQTHDDELSDAEEAAAEQRQELQQNYVKQLQLIDQELEKQRQTLNAKYLQQLNDLRLQAQQSIALEQQKAQQEISTRQQAYQQELAQLQTFTYGGITSISQFATESLNTLTGFVGQARQIMAGLVAAGTPPISTSSSTQRPPGSGGGPQPSPTVNIVVEGYTAGVIQQQLNEVLRDLFP